MADLSLDGRKKVKGLKEDFKKSSALPYACTQPLLANLQPRTTQLSLRSALKANPRQLHFRLKPPRRQLRKENRRAVRHWCAGGYPRRQKTGSQRHHTRCRRQTLISNLKRRIIAPTVIIRLFIFKSLWQIRLITEN